MVLTAALLGAALLPLAACANGGSGTTPVLNATAGPAGVDTTAQPSSSASSIKAKGGCPEGGKGVPKGAGLAKAGDLDGDGLEDEVWIVYDDKARVGVKTASGATFGATFTPESGDHLSAVGNRLGDGTAILLTEAGFTAELFAVIDCKVVPTANVKGAQYSFDLGMLGYGTGVGCPASKGKLSLAGYLSEESELEGYSSVTETAIELSKNGALAGNGKSTYLGDVMDESATGTAATEVSCGDVPAAIWPSE